MTRPGVFVTGGSGFVGRPLLAALSAEGRPVTVLTRSGLQGKTPAGATVVRGDLLEPHTYRDALRSCETVLHLAAATGRASEEEHRRVNARGTEVLVEECRVAGVSNLLFTSSIATTFPDTSGYHYAEAKRRAEDTVSQSGLRFAIIRPTIILGPGAPVLAALEKLARGPVIVVPGRGRVRVQPVHVEDVVRYISETVRLGTFLNETVEIGGPEILTMDTLLQRLRVARTGREGRLLHLPLGLLRLPLRVAEAVGLGRVLPISAGQLSSFQCDGVAEGHQLQERLGPGLRTMAHMLPGAADDTPVGTHPLDAECQVFTRHLLGCDPDRYVAGHYRNAHTVQPALSPASRFDRSLLTFARVSPLCTKIADSYASLFMRSAALRQKLVLLLAILETHPPFHQTIDKSLSGAVPLVVARLTVSTAGALLSLLAGMLIFVPTRVVLALLARGAR